MIYTSNLRKKHIVHSDGEKRGCKSNFFYVDCFPWHENTFSLYLIQEFLRLIFLYFYSYNCYLKVSILSFSEKFVKLSFFHSYKKAEIQSQSKVLNFHSLNKAWNLRKWFLGKTDETLTLRRINHFSCISHLFNSQFVNHSEYNWL